MPLLCLGGGRRDYRGVVATSLDWAFDGGDLVVSVPVIFVHGGASNPL
jgi:hypothetical protein